MRQTVKPQKKSTTPKIYFNPITEGQIDYLKSLEALLKQKRRGDWGLVAEKVGINTASAEKAFLRVFSKNHSEVVTALKELIDNRNNFLKP